MTPPPTICLVMIVRDEEHIVLEGLASVVDLIDRWVVVDTGSSDRTMELVAGFFADRGVPGELHERPWVDFGTNRSEALALAAGRADYLWMWDADDRLVGTPDFGSVSGDGLMLRFGPDLEFWRTQLFRDGLPWRYVGVLHEYPTCEPGPPTLERVEGDYHVEARSLGARSRGPKQAQDIALLTAERERNPDDPRTVFYLAQSHRDAGDHASALEAYEDRVAMGGWDEEVYVARLERARALHALDRPWDEVEAAYLEAWESRPSRLEALHDLARLHRLAGRHARGHLFASWGIDRPEPDDLLFVASDVHRWRLLDEASICAFYLGLLDESAAGCRRLLVEGHLPASERLRVWTNLAWALDAARGAQGRPPTTVSLLHATHRNPEAALEVRARWLDRAVHPERVEHVFAMDGSDAASVTATAGLRRVVVPDDGAEAVTAVRNWNAAAAAATGDLLVVVADDLSPPEGWDRLLDALVEGRDPAEDAFVVKVADSPIPDDVLLRHPVVSRAHHRRHGLWDPAFRGLYCDEDLTRRAFRDGPVIDGRVLVLDHHHPHHDGAVAASESHRRLNAPAEYEHGRAVLTSIWGTTPLPTAAGLVDPAATASGAGPPTEGGATA